MQPTKMVRFGIVSSLILLGIALILWTRNDGAPVVHANSAPVPVLVELFTSEGCSSCPPADRFLLKLDEQQPVAGAEMVVLSEHVDYWNHIGWRDPYSDHLYSERQSAYAKRFDLGSVYTPQMVVDGTSEFTGSDTEKADRAFAEAVRAAKIPVTLSAISIDANNNLHAHVDIAALNDSYGLAEAGVYVAVALHRAESQVSAGENAGHRLAHVSVVKTLTKVAEVKKGQALAQEIQIKVAPGTDPRNLRVIAFVQEPRQGRVLGATMEAVTQ